MMRLEACMWSATMLALAEVVASTTSRSTVGDGWRIAELVRSGLDPSDVAARVLTAIREDELYVFTHHDASWRGELQARFAAILAAMDKAAAR